MMQTLKRANCRMLMSPSMLDVGVYSRGIDTWLVFASGYGATAVPPPPVPGRTAPPTPGWTLPPPAAPARIPPPQVPPAQAPSAPAALSPILATRALELVNEARTHGARCGGQVFGPAPPVTLSGTLANVAFGHATDMAEHNYFEHEDLTGQSPADRVRAVGYREKLVGENIAYGPKSVDEVVQGWLDSPDHCENIMDPRFGEMGIGYATGSNRSTKHGLYWVQVLAEPKA